MRKIMLALVLVLAACGVPPQTPAVSNPQASGSQLSAASATEPPPSASLGAAGSASGSDPGTFATPPLPAPSADISVTPPVDAYPAPVDFPPAPDATVGSSIIMEATATPEDNPPGPAAASTAVAMLVPSTVPMLNVTMLRGASFVDATHGWVLVESTVYATSDAGATWQPRYVLLNASANRIDFVSPTHGFVATTDGVYATEDGGTTWKQHLVAGSSNIVWADFVDERHGYAQVGPDYRNMAPRSLFRTGDGGASWMPITDPCPPLIHPYASGSTSLFVQPSALPSPAIDPAAKPPGAPAPLATGPAVPAPPELPQADALLPPHDVPASPPPVDGGVASTAPITVTTAPIINTFTYSSFSFSSPTNGSIVCAFGNEYPPQKGLFRTQDAGQTWQDVALPAIELAASTPHIFFLDDTHGWIGGEYGTLAATSDGGQTWQSMLVKVNEPRPPAFHPQWVSPQQGYALVGNALWRTGDGGQTWSEILPGPQPYGALHMFDAQRGIATQWLFGQLGIIATDDGGYQWQQIGVLPPACSRWDYSQLHFADATHGWLLGNSGQAINVPSTLCSTMDGGRTWTPLAVPDGVYTGIALIDANIGYLAGGAPNVQPLQGTADGGATWEVIASDQTIDGPIEFWTATDGWAVNNGQIFATADGGQTWTLVPLGYHVRVFDVVPGGMVWVLADDCALGMCLPVLLRSNDMGATWARLRWETRGPSLQDRGYPSGYEPQLPNPPPTGDDMIGGIVDIAFTDAAHGVLLLQDGRVWRTADGERGRSCANARARPLTDRTSGSRRHCRQAGQQNTGDAPSRQP